MDTNARRTRIPPIGTDEFRENPCNPCRLSVFPNSCPFVVEPDRCGLAVTMQLESGVRTLLHGRTGFQPVPNPPGSTHPSMILKLGVACPPFLGAVVVRDRLEACPTASLRLRTRLLRSC